jgi:glycosyltransferase involved in cell wall biosynthesis
LSQLLIATGSFYPDTSGGPSMTLYWLARSLTEQGASVRILSTDRGIPKDIRRNTWHEREFGTVQYVSTRNNELAFTLFFKSLWALRKEKSLYLASFFYPLSFLLATFTVLFTGKQLIWGPRGEMAPEALQFGSRKKQFVLRLIRKLRHKITFHATSEAEIEDIKNAIGQDCRVVFIPNGIYLPEAPPTQMKSARNLLFLGRIHPIKGIDNLIQALALCPAFIHSDKKLELAGYVQESYDLTLQKTIQKHGLESRVQFLGRVEGALKDQLLASAYCLILPSFSENFGAVVAEALVQGTPCIASTGTPWAILETYQAGFHVSNEPQQLASALEKILNLPADAYEQMRMQAQLLATRVLDIRNYTEAWFNLLNEHK